jgi:hypothetical protein
MIITTTAGTLTAHPMTTLQLITMITSLLKTVLIVVLIVVLVTALISVPDIIAVLIGVLATVLVAVLISVHHTCPPIGTACQGCWKLLTTGKVPEQ